MHSRLKLLESFCHLGNRRLLNTCSRDVRCLSEDSFCLSNSFCTMVESLQVDDPPRVTESPKLPDWLKSSSSDGTAVKGLNDNDDFVPPSLTNRIGDYRIRPPAVDHERKPGDMSDNVVDEISNILTNRFESTDDVVESLNCCSVEVTDDLVKQLLERFSFEWIPCLGFFKWAKSRGFEFSPELYNLMVDNLGKCRKFDLMFELVEEMKHLDGYITKVTMSRVMRRLSKAGKVDDAINAFRSLEQFGLSKDIKFMNLLIDALIKHHAIELAEKVYLEFKDIVSPNALTFNILAHGWCIVREIDKAKKIVDEMKKHGFDPNVVTCTSFIEAHCREKDFRKVDDMLKYMEKNGLAPSVVTYTVLVKALGKAKEINKALETYEKMKQQGCVPDSSFYCALIQTLSKSGRWKDAREVFEDMSKQGVDPDTLTYNTMIAAATDQDSREEDALMWLKRMEDSKCKPVLQTYTPLLKMCCKLKRMMVLSFLLSHMFRNNISLNLGTYSLLVSGLCASKNLDRACSFFEEAVKKGFVPMDSMYITLLKGLDKEGMKSEKRRMEELMQQAKLQASVDSSNSFAQGQE